MNHTISVVAIGSSGFFTYIVKHNHLMNNHLNMLPKKIKFDLKCWGSLRRSPRPPNREGQAPPIINSSLRHCTQLFTSLTQLFVDLPS